MIDLLQFKRREFPCVRPPCSYGQNKDLGEEGCYYFNARWYDADTGRFITEDPIRDGQNWYIYVSNNPLKFIDPTGLWTVKFGGAFTPLGATLGPAAMVEFGKNDGIKNFKWNIGIGKGFIGSFDPTSKKVDYGAGLSLKVEAVTEAASGSFTSTLNSTLSLESNSDGISYDATTEVSGSDAISGFNGSITLNNGEFDPDSTPSSEICFGALIMPFSISMDGRDEVKQ